MAEILKILLVLPKDLTHHNDTPVENTRECYAEPELFESKHKYNVAPAEYILHTVWKNGCWCGPICGACLTPGMEFSQNEIGDDDNFLGFYRERLLPEASA